MDYKVPSTAAGEVGLIWIVRMEKNNPPFTVEAQTRTKSKAFPTIHLETIVSTNQGTGEPGGSLMVSPL